jgi:hypothetical protein
VLQDEQINKNKNSAIPLAEQNRLKSFQEAEQRKFAFEKSLEACSADLDDAVSDLEMLRDRDIDKLMFDDMI